MRRKGNGNQGANHDARSPCAQNIPIHAPTFVMGTQRTQGCHNNRGKRCGKANLHQILMCVAQGGKGIIKRRHQNHTAPNTKQPRNDACNSTHNCQSNHHFDHCEIPLPVPMQFRASPLTFNEFFGLQPFSQRIEITQLCDQCGHVVDLDHVGSITGRIIGVLMGFNEQTRHTNRTGRACKGGHEFTLAP